MSTGNKVTWRRGGEGEEPGKEWESYCRDKVKAEEGNEGMGLAAGGWYHINSQSIRKWQKDRRTWWGSFVSIHFKDYAAVTLDEERQAEDFHSFIYTEVDLYKSTTQKSLYYQQWILQARVYLHLTKVRQRMSYLELFPQWVWKLLHGALVSFSPKIYEKEEGEGTRALTTALDFELDSFRHICPYNCGRNLTFGLVF